MYRRDPESQLVHGSEPGERLGQAVDNDNVGAEELIERRSEYVLSFILNVGVLVGKTDLRRLRSQAVGRDCAAATAPDQPPHQLPSAVAAAGLDDEQQDEVEDALASHDDEYCTDAGQHQAEIVLIARHAHCATVACSRADDTTP